MAAFHISKVELKKRLREELQCDYGFIIQLTEWGVIKKLQDAYADEIDSDSCSKEVMNEIYDMYKEYCNVRGLDYATDNRGRKDYREIVNPQKRIVIPPLDEEMKAKLKKAKKKK